MTTKIIQNWTHSQVPVKHGVRRAVVYKVVRNGTRLFQEIRDVESNLIRKLELPSSAPLERKCFEGLLRYVLVDSSEAMMQ